MYGKIKTKLEKWLKKLVSTRADAGSKQGFTLPEVIISFSVLILVITSATGVLVSVIRSNADNVNSLVANGLAQEALESVRFLRDSDVVLGLGFDGMPKTSTATTSVWGVNGEKLFQGKSVKYFTVDLNPAVEEISCPKASLSNCLPLHLRELAAGSDADSLKKSAETLVYSKVKNDLAPITADKFYYYQLKIPNASVDQSTIYHRLLRVEALNSNGSTQVNKLRVSAIVAWTGENGLDKQVVLTTELTDWK